MQSEIVFSNEDVSDQDVVFFATKYLSQFSLASGQYQRSVNYKQFMDDYYKHETGCLGECLSLMLAAGNA